MKSIEKISMTGFILAIAISLAGIVLMHKRDTEVLAHNQADELMSISDTASKSDLAPYVEQQIYGSEMLAGIKNNIQNFNFIVNVYSYEKIPIEGSEGKYKHKLEEIIMPRNNSSKLAAMEDYTSAMWVNPHAKFSGSYLYDKHQEVIGVEFFQKSPYKMVDLSVITDNSVISSLEKAASEFIKEYVVASNATYDTIMRNGEWIIPYERKTYDLYEKYGRFLIDSAKELNYIYNNINNTTNNTSVLIEPNRCLLTYFDLAEVNGLKQNGDFSYRLLGTLMTPRDLAETKPAIFTWDVAGTKGNYAGFNFMRSTSGSYPYYIKKNWSDSSSKDYYGLKDLTMYNPKLLKDYKDNTLNNFNYDGIKFKVNGQEPLWLNNVAFQSTSKNYLFNDADKKLYDLGEFFSSQNVAGVTADNWSYGWQLSSKLLLDNGNLSLQKLNESIGGSNINNFLSSATDVLIEYHRFSSIISNQLNQIKTLRYPGSDIDLFSIDVENKAQLEWASKELSKIIEGDDSAGSESINYYGLADTKENLCNIYNQLIELNKDVVYLEHFCHYANDSDTGNLFPNVIEGIADDIKNHKAECTKGSNCDVKQQLDLITQKYNALCDYNSAVYILCKNKLEPYIDNSLRLIASMINTTEVTQKTSTDNNYNDFIDATIQELQKKLNEYNTRLELLG